MYRPPPAFVVLLAAVLVSGSALAQNAAPAPIVSPEIGTDGRVTFRLRAPLAHKVDVTGEFMSGALELQKDTGGVWSGTTGPIAPEIYHYNFVIDGVRTIDPSNPDVKTGSTPSTIQSILEVRGATPAFYDTQPVARGTVHECWYDSRSLGTLRRALIYTPPGYAQSREARFPVLYLLHGANADETAWTRLGRAHVILDNLIAAGETKPLLVVMPFSYGEPPMARTGGGRNTERFASDLVEDLIPYVEATFRAHTDREHRALAGLSMGGGQALNIGLTRVDLFSHVAAFSAGIRGLQAETVFASLVADPAASNAQLRFVWVGCGRDDGAFAANEQFASFLTQHQIRHVFRATEGAHTWMVWRRYLREIVPQLFTTDAGS